MKRSIHDISPSGSHIGVLDVAKYDFEKICPIGLQKYLGNLLLKGLKHWTGDIIEKQTKSSAIIHTVAENIYNKLNCLELSAIRSEVKSAVEDIAKLLSLKSSSIDCLNYELLEAMRFKLKDYNSANLKVYASISGHHKKIKEVDWNDAVEDDEALAVYAEAAVVMGNKHWVRVGTKWIHDYIRSFYFEELGLKTMRKLHKRTGTTSSSMIDNVLPISSDARVKMLDVGSCFNPFKQYDDLEVTAIDLCPADDSVRKCDFLNIAWSDSNSHAVASTCLPSDKSIAPTLHPDTDIPFIFTKASYSVVVMSLVVSYLPCPKQRLQIIKNARSMLSDHSNGLPGLLLIYEKDSILHSTTYYTTFLNHWKQTIVSVGFDLCRYEHLVVEGAGHSRLNGRKAHVFVFVTKPIAESCCADGYVRDALYIKQDFQDGDISTLHERIHEKLHV